MPFRTSYLWKSFVMSNIGNRIWHVCTLTVCRRWCAMALATPRPWTLIDIALGLALMQMHFQRPSRVNIHVFPDRSVARICYPPTRFLDMRIAFSHSSSVCSETQSIFSSSYAIPRRNGLPIRCEYARPKQGRPGCFAPSLSQVRGHPNAHCLDQLGTA